MKAAKREQSDLAQAEAARVILASPQYDGLARMWALLWAEHRPKLMRTPLVEKKPPTLAERIEAFEGRQRKKRIESRRERWRRREWRVSRKGNYFVRVNHFHVVVFRRGAEWAVRIVDQLSEEFRFSPASYKRVEDAKLGAFDLLTYLESRRSNAAPELARGVMSAVNPTTVVQEVA
jgi:hypothetical protein